LTVTKTKEKIPSGCESVDFFSRKGRCKSDVTEIRACQEGVLKHSINCKWSKVEIDLEPVKYVGPKTIASNTAITAQNRSEDPARLAPTDGDTRSIVNSDLRPGNKNGAGLPACDARRVNGPVNKSRLPVVIKSRKTVCSVNVKEDPTSTKAPKAEVIRGRRRKESVSERTSKCQQQKTRTDSKTVKCNDRSKTVKTRTAMNARICPGDAARAAPTDGSMPAPPIVNRNPRPPRNKNGAGLTAGNARRRDGPVNKNGSPVIGTREKVCPVSAKAPASIETDQRRQYTEGDGDLMTIDSWAGVLFEKDMMLLEEVQCPEIDDLW